MSKVESRSRWTQRGHGELVLVEGFKASAFYSESKEGPLQGFEQRSHNLTYMLGKDHSNCCVLNRLKGSSEEGERIINKLRR